MSDHIETEYSDRAVSESEVVAAHEDHDFGDTTVVLGRVLPFPLYTVVFMGLGILTLIEILLGGLEGGLRIPLLLGIAGVKAALVVYYYMHLKNDSRLFALVLMVPVVVAVISMLFVLATPHAGY